MECFWGASKAAREARRYVSIVADLASRSLGGRVPGELAIDRRWLKSEKPTARRTTSRCATLAGRD